MMPLSMLNLSLCYMTPNLALFKLLKLGGYPTSPVHAAVLHRLICQDAPLSMLCLALVKHILQPAPSRPAPSLLPVPPSPRLVLVLSSDARGGQGRGEPQVHHRYVIRLSRSPALV